MTISSRNEMSNVLKVTGNRTTYKPVELTDRSVFDDARHFYTVDELAEKYSVTKATLLDKHGEAFRAGKDAQMRKPRMILAQLFDELLDKPTLTEPTILEVNGVQKVFMPDLAGIRGLLEFHAKKYEGMGTKVIVEGQAVKYDAVASVPQIIEKP